MAEFSVEDVAKTAYDVYRSALPGGQGVLGQADLSLEQLAEGQREIWAQLAEHALKNFQRMDGRSWQEIAGMFWEGIVTHLPWEAVPVAEKLCWQATLRHMAGLVIDPDDEWDSNDITKAEEAWRAWLQQQQERYSQLAV